MEKPKILYLDQSGVLGGAELMLADIVVGVKLTGKVLLLANGPFVGYLRERGVDVEVVDAGLRTTKSSGLLKSLSSIPALWRTVSRIASHAKNFDLIYANTPKALVTGAMASWKSGTPLLYHLHDILDASHFSSLNIKLLVNLANRFARRVIANSHATAKAFIAAGGKADRIDVVYNGFAIPNHSLSSSDSQRPATASSIEWPTEREEYDIGLTRIVMVPGRIAPWKGQHVLLEALKLLNDGSVRPEQKVAPKFADATMPLWIAWIVGDALFTEEDQQYKRQLCETVDAFGLQDQVRFLGFRKDMEMLYSQCDCVAHCSVAAEPFGRVIVEAMLAGKPVIATDGGGASEIIADGETGWLVQPGDPQALAAALCDIASCTERASQIAMRGRLDARQRFSLEHVLPQVAASIDKAIKC